MPALTTLPILTEEELIEFFGDDLDGLRRYRLLHSVLVAGMTQREAAEASAISERTVRNVLRAYAEGGMSRCAHGECRVIAPRHQPNRRWPLR